MAMAVSSIRLVSKALSLHNLKKKSLVYYTPVFIPRGIYFSFVICFCLLVSSIVLPSPTYIFFYGIHGNVLVKVSQVRSGVYTYLSSHLSERKDIVTLEGWHSHHDSRPQGPSLWVGLKLKVKNLGQLLIVPQSFG